MACLLFATAPVFCPPCEAATPDAGLRIVILAPAAADSVQKLGLDGAVVGVTSRVEEFPLAARVGTHRNPGIENIAALRPTLIIAPARFGGEGRFGAQTIVYEPRSLQGILDALRQIGKATGKEAEAESLAASLAGAIPPGTASGKGNKGPTVLYETRSVPLAFAAQGSFLANLLGSAGFSYVFRGSGGEASAEMVIAEPPQFYIYQVGPMNKNPVPPKERAGWEQLGSCVWEVDELAFARPNTASFALVEALHAILNGPEPCEAGRAFFARK